MAVGFEEASETSLLTTWEGEELTLQMTTLDLSNDDFDAIDDDESEVTAVEVSNL
ncbi:MAG: hypothetical protein AAGM67_07675 [Bacteroidota bacterium]